MSNILKILMKVQVIRIVLYRTKNNEKIGGGMGLNIKNALK